MYDGLNLTFGLNELNTEKPRAEGLPGFDIRVIHQDQLGFLWFGTDNGLARYDGYNFKVYGGDFENPNSIGGKTIVGIQEDSLANFWIATWENGLFFLIGCSISSPLTARTRTIRSILVL